MLCWHLFFGFVDLAYYVTTTVAAVVEGAVPLRQTEFKLQYAYKKPQVRSKITQHKEYWNREFTKNRLIKPHIETWTSRNDRQIKLACIFAAITTTAWQLSNNKCLHYSLILEQQFVFGSWTMEQPQKCPGIQSNAYFDCFCRTSTRISHSIWLNLSVTSSGLLSHARTHAAHTLRAYLASVGVQVIFQIAYFNIHQINDKLKPKLSLRQGTMKLSLSVAVRRPSQRSRSWNGNATHYSWPATIIICSYKVHGYSTQSSVVGRRWYAFLVSCKIS